MFYSWLKIIYIHISIYRLYKEIYKVLPRRQHFADPGKARGCSTNIYVIKESHHEKKSPVRKINGVGPVDNRPSTNKLHHFFPTPKKQAWTEFTVDASVFKLSMSILISMSILASIQMLMYLSIQILMYLSIQMLMYLSNLMLMYLTKLMLMYLSIQMLMYFSMSMWYLGEVQWYLGQIQGYLGQ